MKYKLSVYRRLGGFSFRIRSSNGKLINHVYNRRADAYRAAKRLANDLKGSKVV